MKAPPLAKFILLSIAAWLVVQAPGFFWAKPVPQSIAGMYVFFSVIMILLVMTSTRDGVKGLLGPLKKLAVEPRLVVYRNILVAALPIIVGLAVYFHMSVAPNEATRARVIHPAPPMKLKAYGKTFELATLENPYRAHEKHDPEIFAGLVKEGGEIYFKNCFFCHGAKLDGKGHFSSAMNPRPLPFTGSDTIAQLSESYLFWRITTGGPGLPAEAAPWNSAMPAWEATLSEEDVWKTIIFLYDYTGNRPREWGAHATH